MDLWYYGGIRMNGANENLDDVEATWNKFAKTKKRLTW